MFISSSTKTIFMKKIILGLALLFTTSILINANSNPRSETTKRIVEEFGCARDCVDYALETVAPIRDVGYTLERDIGMYMIVHESCIDSKCSS